MKKYVRNIMVICALLPLIAYYLHFMVGTVISFVFTSLSYILNNPTIAYLGYNGGLEMVPAWTLAINVTVLIYLFYRWDLKKERPKNHEP